MTDARGKVVKISGLRPNAAFGDPAIIWQVSGDAATKFVFNDATYRVDVSGIRGQGIPPSFSYSVTLINPDLLTSKQSIAGPDVAVSNQSTLYAFTPPEGAESIRITTFLKKQTKWTEGAENPAESKVIDRTASNYPLQVDTAKTYPGFGSIAGTKAFNLTFPTLL